MEAGRAMKRIRLNLDLTGVIVLIAAGVLLPVMMATAVGIVALFLARDAGGIVTGVLVICFAVAAAGSAVIAVVLTARKAYLARLQGDFLANVSHELRTPLSVIRLYAQTLASGALNGDPPRTADYLATIVRESEWLDNTLDKVLTWRASSKDMLPLEMTAQPVAAAVDDAVARFRRLASPAGLTFASTVDTRRRVCHDPKAVSGVVLNLLTNAYKYTGDDKRIAVDARDTADGVTIAVRDNGAGIAPADIRRVFDPFRRAHAGGHAGGIGLGLAITRHLVDRHGGRIDVDSRPGEGATFTVWLPPVEEPHERQSRR